MIVDDEKQTRTMLRQMLERADYNVTEAGNGYEALQVFRKHPADLIIMDLIMPRKEGIETIIEMRSEFPYVKIIAMSGGGRIGPAPYLDLAAKLGALRTLSKPIEREVLLNNIREVLEKS
jgi:CheY-like chemotaxis protein